MSMDQKSRFQLYIADAREQLDVVEHNLLALEQSGERDPEVVNKIFRGVHTIKGGADFLGLTTIKRIAHAAEDVLDLARNQQLELTREGVGLLLVVTDTLKEMLSAPDQAETIDISNLLSEINTLAGPGAGSRPESRADADTLELGLLSAPALFTVSRQQLAAQRQQGFNHFILECKSSDDSGTTFPALEASLTALNEIGYVSDRKGPILVAGTNAATRFFVLFRTVLSKSLAIRFLGLDAACIYSLRDREISSSNDQALAMLVADSQAGDEDADMKPKRVNDAEANRNTNCAPRIIASSHEAPAFEQAPAIVKGTDRADAPQEPAPAYSGTSRNTGPVTRDDNKSQGTSNIRVNVEILDNLMNLAGELVLTRNQLNQNVEMRDLNAITLAAQRLDTITTELQESIMSTRMQPISIVLSRFHRVIRDLSQNLHKSINLVMEGEEVELDKSIIENIGDPLTHLVRNAIDHGIETPDKRRAAGKPETGTLSIKARHEAGHVVIEVSDDGKGIDANQIRETALRKGVIDRSRAEEIPEKELLRLIFLPGFSTAGEVSEISGRGVGMDVVFTNLSRLGGTIDIDTTVGKGTSFKIKLPLTLAIVPSLLVSVAHDIFAIPQVNLIELVRLPPGQSDKIEFIGDAAVLRSRGKLLPIVWLSDYLGLTRQKVRNKSVVALHPGSTAGQEGTDSINIVVVAAGDSHYGIAVDHLTDSEEIVVKPLGMHLRKVRGYAGATILGDGRAALILDVAGIAESVSVVSHDERNHEADEKLAQARENIGSEERLLIVENAENEHFGIQLAYVNRIERIQESRIERVGNHNVIKYRGGVLRVFGLEDGLATRPRIRHKHAYLVIFQMLGIEVAIIISNIIDIVDSVAMIDRGTFRQPGVAGSAIILDHITLLLDLFELIKAIDPKMGADMIAQAGATETSNARTVLIVEDSMFFRDRLETLLTSLNIKVLLAEDGQAGWDLLNEHAQQVDLVLMDVEMPRMTGLELTRLLRADPRFRDLPVVMLTSLAKDSDVETGKRAGASEYLIKMDEEMVKQTIFRYFTQNPTPTKKQLAA